MIARFTILLLPDVSRLYLPFTGITGFPLRTRLRLIDPYEPCYRLMVEAVGIEPTVFLMWVIYSHLPSPLGTHLQWKIITLSRYAVNRCAGGGGECVVKCSPRLCRVSSLSFGVGKHFTTLPFFYPHKDKPSGRPPVYFFKC